MNITRICGIAMVALALCAATANAQDKTYVGADGGDWNVSNNWSPSGVPGQAHRVLIPQDNQVFYDVADSTIGALDLASGAELVIETGNVLRLDGDATSGTDGSHSNLGTIILQGSGSMLVFEDMDHVITGAGAIEGQNDSAVIQIEKAGTNDDFSLTNKSVIQGQLVVEPTGAGAGTASFINARDDTNGTPTTGVVHANRSGGVLKFDASLILDDAVFTTYRPLWKASVNSGAELQFNRAAGGAPDGSGGWTATPLSGDFVVANSAVLHFLKTVSTEGSLSSTGGSITIMCEECFFYNVDRTQNPDTFDDICGDDCPPPP